MKRVLFICTKNSTRSQITEALVNHGLAGRFEAFSAGTEASSSHQRLPVDPHTAMQILTGAFATSPLV